MAATVATLCPSRVVEHSKSKSTQPRFAKRWARATLEICYNLSHHLAHLAVAQPVLPISHQPKSNQPEGGNNQNPKQPNFANRPDDPPCRHNHEMSLVEITGWSDFPQDDESFVEIYDIKSDPYQLTNLAPIEEEKFSEKKELLSKLKTCKGWRECLSGEKDIKPTSIK